MLDGIMDGKNDQSDSGQRASGQRMRDCLGDG